MPLPQCKPVIRKELRERTVPAYRRAVSADCSRSPNLRAGEKVKRRFFGRYRLTD